MAKNTPKTSKVLEDIIQTIAQGERITLGEFIGLLEEKAFFFAILILSLPNALPLPGIPGLSTITGLLIAFLGAQMVMGHHVPWLPHSLSNKDFSRQKLTRILQKSLPLIVWLEKLLHPRLVFMASPPVIRALGALFVILSLIIALPIPGGNFLPGLSMFLLALGMIERDGLLLLLASAFSIGSIVLMYKLVALFFAWLIDAVEFAF